MHTWHPNSRVTIRTNLDLHPCEDFNFTFEIPPRPGDRIQSAYEWTHPTLGGKRVLELEIAAIKHTVKGVEIELHLPPARWRSLKDFFSWYEPLTGRKFI
jgi:hypothetical protein